MRSSSRRARCIRLGYHQRGFRGALVSGRAVEVIAFAGLRLSLPRVDRRRLVLEQPPAETRMPGRQAAAEQFTRISPHNCASIQCISGQGERLSGRRLNIIHSCDQKVPLHPLNFPPLAPKLQSTWPLNSWQSECMGLGEPHVVIATGPLLAPGVNQLPPSL